MIRALCNGHEVRAGKAAIALDERGLAYGDGVFETMLLHQGRIRLVDAHLARLSTGCERLGFTAPSLDVLRLEIARLIEKHASGIVKLIVTRGVGGRGYAAESSLTPTRIVMLFASPTTDAREIEVRWCATRLGRNPLLAGIKHLNRLEQVLAQNEAHDPRIAEGLMLDTEGEVVCATSANVFIVSEGALATPDLRFCGVRGVMREFVLNAARHLGLEVRECALRADDIVGADEVFLTNAVRGVRAVTALEDRQWSRGPITQQLMDAVAAR